MKKIFFLLSVVVAGTALWAQTNSPATPLAAANAATNAPAQDTGLHAGHAFYDGNAQQIVYDNHVEVTNAQARLICERLTISLPPSGASDSHPTNILAETNLDIIFINKKGETNHLTADRGVYAYQVIGGITNETCTFSGHATNTTAQGWFSGEPMTWNNSKGQFDLGENVSMHIFTRSLKGTNASPFDILK